MNLIRQNAFDAAVGVVVSDTPDGLKVIRKAGCAATVWRRQTPPGFQDWIDGLDPKTLPSARIVVRADAARQTIEDLLHDAGIADCAERFWFEADIGELSNRFANIMQAPYLRLRLDAIKTNACRRFHIDAIKARMLCTYRGSGTQYGISIDGDEPKRVFQVATGSVMVLRGTKWPEYPASGLLHRSPPIEGTSQTRWVLVLDPVYELEDDL